MLPQFASSDNDSKHVPLLEAHEFHSTKHISVFIHKFITAPKRYMVVVIIQLN
jgi:hypothetical protein